MVHKKPNKGMPQTGLLKRNSTYYINVRVPEDLVSHYRRTHLKASLRTKDRREAVPVAEYRFIRR